MLKPVIDRLSSDPDRATVVNTVAVASSPFNKVQQADLQVIETKGRFRRASTGDPLSPRRFPASTVKSLFSVTYVSMRYGLPVEAC